MALATEAASAGSADGVHPAALMLAPATEAGRPICCAAEASADGTTGDRGTGGIPSFDSSTARCEALDLRTGVGLGLGLAALMMAAEPLVAQTLPPVAAWGAAAALEVVPDGVGS